MENEIYKIERLENWKGVSDERKSVSFKITYTDGSEKETKPIVGKERIMKAAKLLDICPYFQVKGKRMLGLEASFEGVETPYNEVDKLVKETAVTSYERTAWGNVSVTLMAIIEYWSAWRLYQNGMQDWVEAPEIEAKEEEAKVEVNEEVEVDEVEAEPEEEEAEPEEEEEPKAGEVESDTLHPNIKRDGDKYVVTNEKGQYYTFFESELLKLESIYRTNKKFKKLIDESVMDERSGKYKSSLEKECEAYIIKILNIRKEMAKWKVKGYKWYCLYTKVA